MSDFKVGDRVVFGRGNGEQTLGTVVKVNAKSVQIRQDEARGGYPVGTPWRVHPSLVRLVGAPVAVPALAPKRTESEILRDAERVLWGLEPEVLYCDGERSRSEAARVASRLRAQFRGLERELGRKITEFGSIDGHMPATFKSAPAKSSGFKTGDKVTFTAKGKTVTGFIERVNAKTCSVNCTDGKWRVSPGLLTKVA